ncbi:hypothetical protein Nepgr_012152 [Nepenthes gracilis]|uniref:Uncharacterized protein n=1 Tax=Nepenthes gracilis TaxID=150966 RepID=A0AAD3SGG6_NEPGR|nr:hypothetical protein Nepgr_012152 [Nepenthes gracilis]
METRDFDSLRVNSSIKTLANTFLLEMLSKPSIPLVESFAALGLMVEEQEDFLNTMGDFSVQPYLSYSLKDNGPVVPCFSQSPVDFFVPVPLRMSCRNINDSEPPTSARFSILIGQPSDRVNFEGEYSCSFCKMDCFTSEAFLLHLTGCVRDVIRTESKCTGPAINLKTKKDED